MSTTTDIMEACFEHLEDFVYSPAPEILYPALQTDPPSEGAWLEARFFPNEPVDRVWGDEACVEARGFFQVSVCFRTRPGIGQMSPSSIADALIAHFEKGTELGPVRVRKRPWQSPMIVEDSSKSFIPVTVPYWGMIGFVPAVPANAVTNLGEVVTHLGVTVTYTP